MNASTSHSTPGNKIAVVETQARGYINQQAAARMAKGGQREQNWAAPTSTQPCRKKAARRAQWQHLAVNQHRYKHSRAAASVLIN
jgi:hypothetical protein